MPAATRRTPPGRNRPSSTPCYAGGGKVFLDQATGKLARRQAPDNESLHKPARTINSWSPGSGSLAAARIPLQGSAGVLDLGLVARSEDEVAGHAQWLTMGVTRPGVQGPADRGKTTGQSMKQCESHVLSFDRADLIQVGESERRCPEVSDRRIHPLDVNRPYLVPRASPP